MFLARFFSVCVVCCVLCVCVCFFNSSCVFVLFFGRVGIFVGQGRRAGSPWRRGGQHRQERAYPRRDRYKGEEVGHAQADLQNNTNVCVGFPCVSVPIILVVKSGSTNAVIRIGAAVVVVVRFVSFRFFLWFFGRGGCLKFITRVHEYHTIVVICCSTCI